VKSRIAAGEVVERPAGALKELLENALDAGAKRVDVEIAFGGRTLLRVTDDGGGMTRAELALSVRRHATSKLETAEQLFSLATLGFRGEALPSIGAVSRMSIVSRVAASDAAWRLIVKGGAEPEIEPASGPVGTTVEVRDLFFNLPTRKKFLKSASSESAACADVVLRLALLRPDVAFTLSQERQEILNCPAIIAKMPVAGSAGRGPGVEELESLRRRIHDALGRRTIKELTPLRSESPSISEMNEQAIQADFPARARPTDSVGYVLYGFVTPPAMTRPNRGAIYLAVNGRAVRDRTLTSALLEAYRRLVPAGRYPAAVLFLDMPGEDVDINVHPTKSEVRFRYPSLVYSLMHRAVRGAFQGGKTFFPPANASAIPGEAAGTLSPLDREAEAQKTNKKNSTFDLWQGERWLAVPTPQTPAASFPNEVLACEARKVKTPASGELSSDAETPRRDAIQQPLETNARPVSAITPDDFHVLGQAGSRYVIVEDARGVQLLDQHAIHERVLFEELLGQARQGRGDCQGLLLPETVELSPTQAAVMDEEARSVLLDLGFEVEDFGPRALVIRGVPAVLKSGLGGRLVTDFLDELVEGKKRDGRADGDSLKNSTANIEARTEARVAIRQKAAYVIACKSAFKAGERLNMEQMTVLIREYRRVVGCGGWTCPHGRPAAVELSWQDLARGVGRT
jgi:DNA mismatch repair protein MutL